MHVQCKLGVPLVYCMSNVAPNVDVNKIEPVHRRVERGNVQIHEAHEGGRTSHQRHTQMLRRDLVLQRPKHLEMSRTRPHNSLDGCKQV
jgi:hypothetical protein